MSVSRYAHVSRYTNHYYNGSERIASKLTNRYSSSVQSDENYDELQAAVGEVFLQDVREENEALALGFIENNGINPQNVSSADLIYYFHPDHLGTATYLSDADGNPYQFFLNLPYGETMAEQRTGLFDNPYKFNGKELDAETGYYYYGARYYNPMMSVWLSVDPLSEKFVSWSPFKYANDNPINFVHLNGFENISALI